MRPWFHHIALLALLLGCAACSGGDTPSRGNLHLFEIEPLRIDEGESILPAPFLEALAEERVWIVGERPRGDYWRPASAAEVPPSRLRNSTRFPVAGPTRLLTREEIALPGAGRELAEGEGRALEPGETSIGPGGIEAALLPGELVPDGLEIAYPTLSSHVTAELAGTRGTAADGLRLRRLNLEQEERRVLYTAPPSRHTWRVEIPADAVLRFAYGLRALEYSASGNELHPRTTASDAGGEAPPKTSFRITTTGDDRTEHALWAGAASHARADRFHSATCSLEALAGRTVELTLEVVNAAGDGEASLLPFWSEPVVDARDPDERPSVVVVLLDTLRADRLGCYGYPRRTSPALDALAAKGVRYADVTSAAPWTLPAHASLFCSLYATQHGVWYRERLSERLTTVAEVLRGEGYHTFAVTEGLFLHPRFGLGHGFDRYGVGPRDVAKTVDATIETIRELRGRFFAFVQTYQVHAPLAPPAAQRAALVRPYDGELPRVVNMNKWGVLDDSDRRYIGDLYDAELAWADENVARLLAFLEETDRLDDTLIVVTSDHGEELNDHGGYGHGHSLYQEQLRIPLILYQKGVFEGGLVVEEPVLAVDIAPTLARTAGAPIPEEWVGVPLDAVGPRGRRPLFIPYFTKPDRRPSTAYREGALKVIHYPGSEEAFDAERDTQLFDLTADGGERSNLWNERYEELNERIRELWRRYPPRSSGSRAHVDSAMQEDLEGMGYAGGD